MMLRESSRRASKLFLSLTNIWLSTHEQQYSLMDTAQIMVTKIIGIRLFIIGASSDCSTSTIRSVTSPMVLGVAANLSRIALLSNRIQAFYREWHALDQPITSDAFVDCNSPSSDFMVQLHTGMAAKLHYPPSWKLNLQLTFVLVFFPRLSLKQVY